MIVRKLVITAGVLGALVVGADMVAQRAAESALSKTASEALGIDGDVTIDIEGFPILFDVLRGRLDGVTATVTNQRIQDLRFTRLGVTLDDLRAEGSMFGSGPLAIVSARTTLLAETDAQAVNAFLRKRGEDARVEFVGAELRVTATRTVLGIPRRFVATGSLILDGKDIVFRPREVDWDGPSFPGADRIARDATTFRERMPDLPAEARLDAVEIGDGVLRLTGSAAGQRFVVRS